MYLHIHVITIWGYSPLPFASIFSFFVGRHPLDGSWPEVVAIKRQLNRCNHVNEHAYTNRCHDDDGHCRTLHRSSGAEDVR